VESPRKRNHRASGAATAAVLLVFLVPGGSMLEVFQQNHPFAPLEKSWLWIHFVMPHQVWALLILSFLLLTAMRQTPATVRQ
jgi:hypothetical protein